MADRPELLARRRAAPEPARGRQRTPHLYGDWTATPDLTVKGGVSTRYRAPDIPEITPGHLYPTGGGCMLDLTAAQPRGAIVGDPDLKAETSTNYKLGLLHGTGNLSLGATYFHNEIQNKIANARALNEDGSVAVYPDDPRYTLLCHYNIGEARIHGLELTGDWYATNRLNLRATYTCTDREQLNCDHEGYPLARTPEHLASLRADRKMLTDGLDLWGVTADHGKELGIGLRVGENCGPVNEGGVVGPKHGAYATVDLGVSYDVNDTVTLGAAI